MTNFFKFLQGIIIGLGAILPGISSGVLCVIFGLYDKLLYSVLHIFKSFKQNFLFLLPIAIGSLIGVIFFGNLLKYLLLTYPMPVKFCFIGLILGSIPLLLKQISTKKKFRLHYLLYTLISLLIGFGSVYLEKSDVLNIIYNIDVTCFNYHTICLLILVGFFMSLGMIIPGLSSTVILMCFGIYDIYLGCLSSLNIYFLVPLTVGVSIGFICFIQIINYLIKNYYAQSFYSIIGFTIGSVFVLYEPITNNEQSIFSICLLIICFYSIRFLERFKT